MLILLSIAKIFFLSVKMPVIWEKVSFCLHFKGVHVTLLQKDMTWEGKQRQKAVDEVRSGVSLPPQRFFKE